MTYREQAEGPKDEPPWLTPEVLRELAPLPPPEEPTE